MSIKKLHALILFSFLVLSIVLTLGRVGTAFNSFALLVPDLGVYASLSAAQDNPELFVRDPFLSNEKNINSYNMLHIPLLKTLNKVFGNYGTAAAFLLPFAIFLHLSGYYLLGVSIFKNPWAGLLVSLLLSTPTVTYYDFWGLILDALPGFLYQSLIPFVLALSIRYGRNPQWWPLILGAVGILNYVHPLSTPSWSIAVMLALWMSVPELSFWERIRKMTLAGLVLLAVLVPFIANYVNSTVLEVSNVISYEQTLSILESRFSTMSGQGFLFPITVFFARGVENSFDIVWYLVWVFGVGGIVVGLIYRRDVEGTVHLRQIAAWILGIFFVGGFVPAVEQIVFAYLRQIPPEFEILRTLRYLVPLILLAVIYTFWLITGHLQKKYAFSPTVARKLYVGAGISFLLLWGASSIVHRSDFRSALRQSLSCWLQGQMVCDLPPRSMDLIDMMNVIRDETPVGARVFSEGQEVAIRYYALRPLVFTYKDGAPLAYTDQEQLLIWSGNSEDMDKLAFIRKFPFRRKGFVNGITELAERIEADYLMLREPYDRDLYYPEQLRFVYTNEHYSLFEINAK